MRKKSEDCKFCNVFKKESKVKQLRTFCDLAGTEPRGGVITTHEGHEGFSTPKKKKLPNPLSLHCLLFNAHSLAVSLSLLLCL